MWRDEAYLLDMLLAARKIQKFAEEANWEDFRANEVLQNATMHLVQIIGEAARSVSPEIKAAHPQIPWQEIVGMRHRLVHEYFRVIPERVWDVIVRDLPLLIDQLQQIVPPDKSTG